MADGRFIGVVGPSGVGKDSIMNVLCETLPSTVRCRRTITRAPEAGGEDYEAVDEATFQSRVDRGDFILWWSAHGLHYGIPQSVRSELRSGKDVVANLSRSRLAEANALFDNFIVLSITANQAALADRLAARGRESEENRAKRLERASLPLPTGLPIIEIDNSGTLAGAVSQALVALQHPRTQVSL